MGQFGTERSRRAVPAPVEGRVSGRSRQLLPGWNPRTWLVALPLVLVVIAAFLPALDNGFVNWDDEKNFLNNPHYRGLAADQVKWAFTTFWLGVYQPLAWLLFEVEYVCWTLDPRGYHLTSVILHAINVVVLYVLTVTLLVRCRPDSSQKGPWTYPLSAGLATALFAVHPLRVEGRSLGLGTALSALRLAFHAGRTRLSQLVRSRLISSAERACVHVRPVRCRRVVQGGSREPAGGAVNSGRVPARSIRRPAVADGSPCPAVRTIWYEKLPFVAVSLIFMAVAIAARGHSLTAVALQRPRETSCSGVLRNLV